MTTFAAGKTTVAGTGAYASRTARTGVSSVALTGAFIARSVRSAAPLSTEALIRALSGQARPRPVAGQLWPRRTPNRSDVLIASPFSTDLFTDAAGTALATHVGDKAAAWTKHTSFAGGSMVITNANRVRSVSGASASVYYTSGVPPTPQYDVTADLLVVSNTVNPNAIGLVARIDTAADTMYQIRYNLFTGQWQLIKRVAGVTTTLATAAAVLNVGQSYAMKFVVRDAAKTLYVDGVSVLTSADNTITAAGRAGVLAQQTSTDTTGMHLDNFNVIDDTTYRGLEYPRPVSGQLWPRTKPLMLAG